MKLLNKINSFSLNTEILSTMTIVLILVLLFSVYLYFFRKKKEGFIQFIRHFLLPYTIISGVAVYFIGYQFGRPDHNVGWSILPNILESVFSTTRLFILGNDLVEINESVKVNALFHAMFSLTAALAAFIFISFIAQVFFTSWLVRNRIKRIHADENHFFFGINQGTLSLSNDLCKSSVKRLVVFINDFCNFENHQLYTHINEKAFVVKRKSFSDSINLEKEEGLLQYFKGKENHSPSETCTEELFHHLAVLKKKIGEVETHLYFLTDDDDWNIKHARLAISELKNLVESKKKRRKQTAKNPATQPIQIHVATFNEISEKHFTKSLENLPEFISVVVHNYATLVSRQLIKMHHPVDFVDIDNEQTVAKSDFNALIIGFGQIGTHVLRKLIEQGQFVGSTFHATVIDKSVHAQEGRFEHLYPGIIANYNVHFVEAEVGHHSFYKTVKSVIDKTNYIVIALGQDDLNIQTALEILEINSIKDLKLFKLFIQLEDETHWKETLKKYEKQISIFGESDQVFTENNILQHDVEERARLVHQVYNILNKSNICFEKIPRHDQLSNISVAEHLYAKVRLLGYKDMDEFSNKFASNDEFINSLTKLQELNLSILEHLRWNAFHFIHGWTALPLEKISGETNEERDRNRRKDDLRIHACLTTWENLKHLGELIGKDMQEYDTKSVKHLYDFINYHSNEKR